MVWLVVAWGVLTFGAVYAWACIPLLLAATAAGGYGWYSATAGERATARPVAVALLLVVLVPIVQLIPLPYHWLVRVSPATDRLLQEYDLVYAAARRAGDAGSHPLSVAPGATLDGLARLAALAMFLVGSSTLVARLRLSWLVRAVVATAFALAVFGIVQHATFNGRIYWWWRPLDDPRNAFGPFVNRNHFAGWMLMATSLGAGYFCGLVDEPVADSHGTWRTRLTRLASVRAHRLLFTGGALLLMVLSIVWTLSRSGIAALVAVIALVGCQAVRRLRGSRRLVLTALLGTMLAAALIWRDLATLSTWYGNTGTLWWRWRLWQDTVPIVHDFLWFGTGLNTYGISTLFYPASDPAWHAAQAHSDYLQILSEGGLLLTAAVLTAVVVFMHRIRRAFAEPQSVFVRWVRTGATVGLIAVSIQETVDFSLQLPGNAVLFALLAAIALHRARPHNT